MHELRREVRLLKAGIKLQHEKAEMEEKQKKPQPDDQVGEKDIKHYIPKIEISCHNQLDKMLSEWKRCQCRSEGSLRVVHGRGRGGIECC